MVVETRNRGAVPKKKENSGVVKGFAVKKKRRTRQRCQRYKTRLAKCYFLFYEAVTEEMAKHYYHAMKLIDEAYDDKCSLAEVAYFADTYFAKILKVSRITYCKKPQKLLTLHHTIQHVSLDELIDTYGQMVDLQPFRIECHIVMEPLMRFASDLTRLKRSKEAIRAIVPAFVNVIRKSEAIRSMIY